MRKIKEMLPFLTVIMISYYLLPLLINEINTGFFILFVVIPLICFISSIIYGINYSLNVLFIVCTAVLFIPSMLIIGILPIWGFVIGYGIVALIGNAIGMIFFKRNVRIKNLEKYSRYLMITVVGSYIVAAIASVIMMNQMTQVIYNSTEYGSIWKQISIDFENNTAWQIIYEFNGDGEIKEHRENPLSDAAKMKIKAVCAFSLFPLWQKSFDNPWVMDGDQYNIVRNYKNGNSVIYGSNAYPLTYWLVYRVIYNSIE